MSKKMNAKALKWTQNNGAEFAGNLILETQYSLVIIVEKLFGLLTKFIKNHLSQLVIVFKS